ncbi:MAG: hypothetical protein ACT4P4_19980 [Betaproteobacteria bacterium]
MNPRRRTLCGAALLAAALGPVSAGRAGAQVFSPPAAQPEPERIRGQIVALDGASLELKTRAGPLRLAMPDKLAIFALGKASFTDLDFGFYVGAVSERLGDNIYSPIVRDSLSWLHRAIEIRIIDESLRGIALGHRKWDLTPASVMTHGWIDDFEERVISIKYGPTDQEETDVEIPRGLTVLRMSSGERSLLRPGAQVFAGAPKRAEGRYDPLQFIFVGRDGIAPRL